MSYTKSKLKIYTYHSNNILFDTNYLKHQFDITEYIFFYSTNI